MFYHKFAILSYFLTASTIIAENYRGKVAAVLQRKDDAKCLQRRYTKEMNVKMALLFFQAEQQAALPPEQRQVKLEDVCKVASV